MEAEEIIKLAREIGFTPAYDTMIKRFVELYEKRKLSDHSHWYFDKDRNK